MSILPNLLIGALCMTVTSCIYALLSPNPPVCQNWGGGGRGQILAMRKRLLMKLAPKHIHSTQRPTVVLWEGRYITPHQLYQVGKYWWSLFLVNTPIMNNKCLPAWFFQMTYRRSPNALQLCLRIFSHMKVVFLYLLCCLFASRNRWSKVWWRMKIGRIRLITRPAIQSKLDFCIFI